MSHALGLALSDSPEIVLPAPKAPRRLRRAVTLLVAALLMVAATCVQPLRRWPRSASSRERGESSS
jgi:hypothetical protein